MDSDRGNADDDDGGLWGVVLDVVAGLWMVLVHDMACIGELEEEGHWQRGIRVHGFSPARFRFSLRFPHAPSSVHSLFRSSRFNSWQLPI